MSQGTNIYFVSDLHLGVPSREKSLERERAFCNWLDEVAKDALEIFILGDIFDFWFEYKHVVPKGFTRLLGKLAALTDAGIPITVLSGNHDQWMKTYFLEELNIPVFHQPIQREWNGVNFFIGHGDGLGPGDKGYKLLKKLFHNGLARKMFHWVHPDIAFSIARYFSRKSRASQVDVDQKYSGKENEWLYIFAKEMEQDHSFNYYIFGHRHLPLNLKINETSKYLNLGDWIQYFTYAKFDGTNVQLSSISDSTVIICE